MENNEKKLTLAEKIREKLNTGALESFFMGKWYPLAVAALVMLGHTFGLEIYLCLVNMILFALAILTCNSVRPLIIALCTFTWQLPLAHTPGGPVWSDHFIKGANPYIFGLSVLIIVLTFIYLIFKFEVFKNLSFRNTPLLVSMCALGAAFLLNGAFSSTWELKSLLYGALLAVLFPFLFLVFYKGMKREKNPEELGLYFAYIASVMAVVLFLQMMDLYILGNDYYGSVFNSSGSVIKERIHLGWATWNPAGISASVLVPLCFLGAIKGKNPWGYLVCAVLAYLAAILTFSRNSLIMATLGFAASIIIACLVGERRRKLTFRLITALGAVAILFFAIVFFKEIKIFAKDIFDRGFSDNGRFSVWATATANFKSKPIFGTGFYYFNSPLLYDYSALPLMAHQTFLQLLSAMGFVGLLAYIYYRIDTVEMFVLKPTLVKSMLGISVLVLLGGSLLDNFIFTIFPTFLYSAELAAAALIYEGQKEEEALELSRERRRQRRKRKK